MILRTLSFCLVFFSLAQPAIYLPGGFGENLFFALALLTAAVYFFKRGPEEKALKIPQSLFVYGMVVAYTLSEAQYFWVGGTFAVFLFWFKKAFLYYLIVHIAKDEKDLRRLVWASLLAILVLVYYGWDLFLNSPPGSPGSLRLETVGNYNNPNSVAFLLTLAFPLCFFLMESRRNLFPRLFLIALMALFVLTSVFTKSRGGLLGMLIAVMMSFLFSQSLIRRKWIKTCFLVLTVLLFAGYGVQFTLLRPDVTSFTGTGGEASAGDRLMAWVAALRMFASHPLLGVGWEKFPEMGMSYGMDRKLLVHNTPLSILAETGIVGIACFLGIAFYSFKGLVRIRRDLRSDPGKRSLSALVNGVFVSFICFFVNTAFSVKDQDPMYWHILALVGASCAIYQRETRTKALAEAEDRTVAGQTSQYREMS